MVSSPEQLASQILCQPWFASLPPPPPLDAQPHTPSGDSSPPRTTNLDPAIAFIIAGADTLRAPELPDRIAKYEAEHDETILSAAQHEEMRDVCNQYSETDLTGEDIKNLLTTVRHNRNAAAVAAAVTPQAKRPNRRQSTRIRSPGESPSTSDEEEIMSRLASDPRPAPATPSRSASADMSYIMPLTLSTSEAEAPAPIPRSQSATQRFENRNTRDDAAPHNGIKRRPLSQHQGRRSSGRSVSMRSDESIGSIDSAMGHRRGSSSVGPLSPQGITSPMFPASPPAGPYADYTPGIVDVDWEGDRGIRSFIDKRDQAEIARLTAEREEHLGRIKSLEHERNMIQQAHDLVIEDYREATNSQQHDHDVKVKDQVSRLEAKHRMAVEAKEVEIGELQAEIEAGRARIAEIQANWDAEKEKRDELASVVAERDDEVNILRMDLDHASEERERISRELGLVNEQNAEMVKRLDENRLLEANLAAKASENRTLQALLEDVRRELDDLRSPTHPGGGISSAGPATLTRNGGLQLSSELQAAQQQVVLHTTTITRTIHSGGGSHESDDPSTTTTYADASTSPEPLRLHTLLDDPELAAEYEAARRHEEEPRTPRQRSFSEEALRSPPAYSAEAGPIDVDAVKKYHHPETPMEALGPDEDLQKAYDIVAKGTGKRCLIHEDEIEAGEAHRHKLSGGRDRGLVERVIGYANGLTVVQMGGLMIVTMFATSLFGGSGGTRDPLTAYVYDSTAFFEHTKAMANAGFVPT